MGSQKIAPAQSRAGRALVAWSQARLAKASGMSQKSVHEFEHGRRSAIARTYVAIRRTLEAAGVAFVTDDGGPGVRLNRPGRPDGETTVPPELTAPQGRAARALLEWSQQDVATSTGLSTVTIAKFEGEKSKTMAATAARIRRAFEAAGVEFHPATAEAGAGVRLRRPGEQEAS